MNRNKHFKQVHYVYLLLCQIDIRHFVFFTVYQCKVIKLDYIVQPYE